MSPGLITRDRGFAYIIIVAFGGIDVRIRGVISIISAFFIIFSTGVKASFDQNNVSNIVMELASDKYQGRLSGTEGNILAEEYIEGYFKEVGLKGIGNKGSYFQEFYGIVPIIEGNSYFKVYNNNKLIKEYRYGVDFKEIHYGLSTPGIVKGRLIIDSKSNGNILLNQGSLFETPKLYESDDLLISKGIRGVISPAESMDYKDVYRLQNEPNPSSKALVKILVSPDIIPELIRFSKKDYSFEIKTGVINKRVLIKNVIGVIEGRNKNLPPIILSAHFDNVGYDSDGKIYPGALDNASGTAFIMECARVLKSMEKPKRTIIFIAFNGNKIDHLGSKIFLENPSLNIKGAYCINFDMIGSSKDIPISISYSLKKDELAMEMESIAKANSIECSILEDEFSDHLSFNLLGLNSVTFSNKDLEKTHTIYDNIDNINSDNLKYFVIMLNEFFKSKGISPMPNPYVKVNPIPNYDIYISFLGAFITVILIHFYEKRLDKSQHLA